MPTNNNNNNNTSSDIFDWLNTKDDKPWNPNSVKSKEVDKNDSDYEEEEQPQPVPDTNNKTADEKISSASAMTETKIITIHHVDDPQPSSSFSTTIANKKKIEIQQQDEDDVDEDGDSHFSPEQEAMLRYMNSSLITAALIQLHEQELRNEMLLEESDERSTVVRFLMLRVFVYVRDKEQSLVHDGNRKLITNDLIAELVGANKTMRSELNEIYQAIQSQQQQHHQQQRMAASASSRGGRGGNNNSKNNNDNDRARNIRETF